MYVPIQPARLEFNPAGIPCSSAYGDVYHSCDGGLGQARHVFLKGNGLPGRWAGQRRFVIVETGFGLGLNFLATWATWRADPERCGRLHFISCEKHPFRREDLIKLHQAWPELAPLAAELQAHWPTLTPGFHRLHLEGGRVILTLLFGEAAETLAELEARTDAIYLDGFSPALNPELWSPKIFHLLARLAAPGATLATWSVAGAVREGLTRAGFKVEKREGFGDKRQMLTAALTRAGNAIEPPLERHAIVVGAGVAGTAAAQRLAERGWRIDLIDGAPGPGQGASGNLAGVLRPLPSLDDNRLARITRAGTLYGRHHLARLAQAGHPVRWNPCGVLHLARELVHERKQRKVVEAHQPPAHFLRFVEKDEAAAIAGWPVDLGGWWFPEGGWIQPPSLCAANLAAAGPALVAHFGQTIIALERREGCWHALAADGRTIAAAPVLILANGTGIRALPQAASLPVVAARGQVSHLPAQAGSAPRAVVCRLGYVSPEVDGLRCAGATFQVDDPDPALRAADHQENLAKLDFILPGYSTAQGDPPLVGRVGFRPASPDRLPMVGAMPQTIRLETPQPLATIPRQPGLYAVSGFGARGLVWSSLMGELLACALEGEPLPLERSLVDAVDPARYLLRPGRPLAREE
ncbi:MAG: bifunctional tRNA (5-methylaminomethyl-2-thiouridine)(34)-methyltransferase MnmD/FAD-dependent 5-carboxymethylaminomethyl-2-thiouridine(34) oxidoreductase MnmC [Rhodocyclaceae bacterium]|jgi:tRNA 5-methylaminomethyl-2-thiouridine biosynthesis bifunctional protein|nr:bifunctional tRNA (5-methylaminomethyl-2-thiouridine)(34)-methyltransferase MnmD/FAD-dependent 5-carboxymethylaminomethyl-2-thiouridine(34) oxidoreductase MnmC [Rhodocyclaceae bacterium]